MLSCGFLEVVDGCLSTGKEANVYYAKAGRAGVGGGGSAMEQQHTKTKGKGKGKAKGKAAVKAEGKDEDKDEGKDEDKNGTVSTAPTPTPTSPPPIAEYAIKIYKTSILVFKDRDRYVSGEHRFRRGYCKSNPRKMVKVWAEKELRNYKRIYGAGIPCPQPILLRGHVLVMEFLGQDGWPSPRIRDAGLSERRLREAYVQTVLIMRRMFMRCKLVHGDLSEYNLLWHDNMVYVIDVSQSVESDHPSALDFLRMDCNNVNDYYRKAGNLVTMTTRQLFEFVTSTVVGHDEADEYAELDRIMDAVQVESERVASQSEEGRRATLQKVSVNEAVFLSQFLPRSLNQVAEYDVGRLDDGDVEVTYARAVAALTGNEEVVEAVEERSRTASGSTAVAKEERNGSNSSSTTNAAAAAADGDGGADDGCKRCGEQQEAKDDQNNENEKSGQETASDHDKGNGADEDEDYDDNGDNDEDDDDDDDDGSEEGEGEGEGRRYTKVPMTPQEVIDAKEAKRVANKANKKAVREAKSEKRLTKIKKKDKRRAIKKTKGNKKK